MGNLCSGASKEEYQSINQMARTTNTQNDGKKYGHTYATPMRHGVRYSVPDKSGPPDTVPSKVMNSDVSRFVNH
uniref:Uncharacterized protein n=1 Tax=Acrobeloides nanus TaxID=290746 RepID=A0A914D342_9BILA